MPKLDGMPDEGVVSNPPPGYHKVVNIYRDPATGKLIVEYDDDED